MLASAATRSLLLSRPMASRLVASTATTSARQQFHATRSVGKPRRTRRPTPTTRRGAGSPPPAAAAATAESAAPSAAAQPPPTAAAASSSRNSLDPHQTADANIAASSDARIPGTVAIASLTPEQKMRNYGLAAFLVGFVTWVWWYSIQSVGKAEAGDGIDELRAEAEEAREKAEEKALGRREAEELAGLEVTMGNLEKSQGGGELIGSEELSVAVAAPEEVARMEEEEQSLAAARKAGQGGSGGRPLWKKVVFFWRRE